MVLVVRKLPANAWDIRDTGLIPGWGRSPGGGHGSPLQSSCLENPMDRGAWKATAHNRKESDTNEPTWHTHTGRQSLYWCHTGWRLPSLAPLTHKSQPAGDISPAVPAPQYSRLEATSRHSTMKQRPYSPSTVIPLPAPSGWHRAGGQWCHGTKLITSGSGLCVALCCFTVVSLNLLSLAVLIFRLLHILPQNPVHAAAPQGQQELFVGNAIYHKSYSTSV